MRGSSPERSQKSGGSGNRNMKFSRKSPPSSTNKEEKKISLA